MNNQNEQTILSIEEEKQVENPVRTDPVERVEQMRIQHAKEKKTWKEKYNKLANQNIDLGDKLSETEDKMTDLEIKVKSLDKELWRERRQSNAVELERELSESQKVGLMALDIIKKRCAERYNKN